MSTDTHLVNRRVGVKRSIASLGAALDAAEKAVDAADARGDDSSNYDLSGDDGSFQHDRVSCPYCALETSRREYLGAIRDAVVARREALLEWALPQDEPFKRRLARIRHCRDERSAARAAYAQANTARAKCDAAAKVERAESDFEVIFRKTVTELTPKAIQREWLAVRKRRSAAQWTFDIADPLGTKEQAAAARQVLEDVELEVRIISFVIENLRARLGFTDDRCQAELRAEWDCEIGERLGFVAKSGKKTAQHSVER